jgi:hypothetical protein
MTSRRTHHMRALPSIGSMQCRTEAQLKRNWAEFAGLLKRSGFVRVVCRNRGDLIAIRPDIMDMLSARGISFLGMERKQSKQVR